jgi:hypothetical protein
MSWIKVDTTLVNKPKVVQISRNLKKKREETLGFLIKFWCLVDGLTEDGFLPGYDRVAVDDLVGLKGFAKALQVVDWLDFNDDGCVVARYDKHNGNSAKKRAEGALRKARFVRNQSNKKVTQDALPSALPREDKSIDSRESIPGAGVCTPTREDSPSQISSSRPDIREALGLGGQQEWPEDEVEKWWLWNDARGWQGVVNWRSSLAMWMKRTRPESSEPNSQPAKISAPPAALEMDVSVEVD